MAKRTVRELLLDLAGSIEKIDRFLGGRTFEVFKSDALIHDAVVWNLEIVSEASRYVPEELKGKTPQIPWREIADFGNILRHGYEGVNDAILWSMIRRDLPMLTAAIQSLLADVP